MRPPRWRSAPVAVLPSGPLLAILASWMLLPGVWSELLQHSGAGKFRSDQLLPLTPLKTVLEAAQMTTRAHCLSLCSREPSCVSFNFGQLSAGERGCQLLTAALCTDGSPQLSAAVGAAYFDLYRGVALGNTELSMPALRTACETTGRCAVPLCAPSLGSVCSTNELCSESLANTECSPANGTCACISTAYVTSDGICEPGVALTAACTDSIQCQTLASSSLCTGGVCACDSGYYNSDNSACLPVVALGGACSVDAACDDVTTKACVGGVCACASGYVQSGAECYVTASLGAACTILEQCTAVATSSLCTGGVCVCDTGYYNSDNAACLPVVALGGACSVDAACDDVTTKACVGGVCACASGYVQSGAECYVVASLGAACTVVEQCTASMAGTTCSGGVCSCPAGTYNYQNTACRTAVAFNQVCTYTEDCTATDTSFSCVDGTCNNYPCSAYGHTHNGIAYEFRIAGTGSCSQGRAEVRKAGGQWGQICDDGWDDTDASVFCRSVGYSSGTGQLMSAYYNTAWSVRFWLDDMACTGSESTLMGCRDPSLWGSHNCGTGETSGVTCS